MGGGIDVAGSLFSASGAGVTHANPVSMHPAVSRGTGVGFVGHGLGALGFFPLARSMHTAVSTMTLAVRAVTLAMREALFLTSCMSVVHLVVAAAARLLRYPLSWANVSGVMGASLAMVTALVELWKAG